MAFFEEIGKKLTETGQGVAKQTKNLTEIARLNGVISEKKKEINALFLAIGQAYYNRHKLDAAEEVEKIQEISLAYEKIEQCQKEISAIKEGVHCPKCDAPVNGENAFCTNCGTKLI